MAVLVIAQYEVNDPAPYREYAQNAYPTVLAHEGEFVVFDPAAETLEGKPPGPQTVVIKFESIEKAKEWYYSEEYQEIVDKRLAVTDGFAVFAKMRSS